MAVLDDFNRANESPLSNGGQWTGRGVGGLLTVSSNQCAGSSNTANTNSSYWNAATYVNVRVGVTVTTIPSGSNRILLFLRMANPGTGSETAYVMRWKNSGTGDNLQILDEQSRNDFTHSLASSASATFSANDVIEFEAAGATLTVYQNGSNVLQTTNSTYTSAGNVGLGNVDTTTRFDDFAASIVTVEKPLSASVAGSSAVSVDLTVDVPVSPAAVSGAAAVSASIVRIRNLSPAVSGGATVTAKVKRVPAPLKGFMFAFGADALEAFPDWTRIDG